MFILYVGTRLIVEASGEISQIAELPEKPAEALGFARNRRNFGRLANLQEV